MRDATTRSNFLKPLKPSPRKSPSPLRCPGPRGCQRLPPARSSRRTCSTLPVLSFQRPREELAVVIYQPASLLSARFSLVCSFPCHTNVCPSGTHFSDELF